MWQGIVLRSLWSPHGKHAEAFVHTFLAVTLARWYGARIIHLHAVGNGLAIPYARILGLKVLLTHHGFDYHRKKWGRAARLALRLGEHLAARYAHVLFGVSPEVCRHLTGRYGREVVYLPNGVPAPSPGNNTSRVPGATIPEAPYILAVGRLVPEKGLDTLLEAFVAVSGLPVLVIVGGADQDSEYAQMLKRRAADRVRFLGRMPHETTLDLIRHACLLVLPSLHEGLPITLLEGLAAGTTVLASDIAVHREVLEEGRYGLLFHTGDAADLRERLREAVSMDEETRERIRCEALAMVRDRFSWEATAGTFLNSLKAVSL